MADVFHQLIGLKSRHCDRCHVTEAIDSEQGDQPARCRRPKLIGITARPGPREQPWGKGGSRHHNRIVGSLRVIPGIPDLSSLSFDRGDGIALYAGFDLSQEIPPMATMRQKLRRPRRAWPRTTQIARTSSDASALACSSSVHIVIAHRVRSRRVSGSACLGSGYGGDRPSRRKHGKRYHTSNMSMRHPKPECHARPTATRTCLK